MMKRTLLLSLLLLLAALFVLSACTDGPGPGPDETTDTTTAGNPETIAPAGVSVSTKYIEEVNGLNRTAGTFTDRLTAEQLMAAQLKGGSITADPLLYNLIQVAELTKDDLTLYSELNGGLLEAAWIDALFLEPEAMRDALRAPYTIMAGGYPYTVFDLANMPEADLAALNISAADLAAFLAPIPAAAEAAGEQLDEHILFFIETNTAK